MNLQEEILKFIKNDQAESVKQILENTIYKYADIDYLFKSTASSGRINLVKHLYRNSASVHKGGDFLFLYVVENNYLEVVKYLIEKYDFSQDKKDMALQVAIDSEYYEMVKYLHENGANIDIRLNHNFIELASKENLELLKYLCENGKGERLDKEMAFAIAVDRGNLEMLKYLNENDKIGKVSQDFLGQFENKDNISKKVFDYIKEIKSIRKKNFSEKIDTKSEKELLENIYFPSITIKKYQVQDFVLITGLFQKRLKEVFRNSVSFESMHEFYTKPIDGAFKYTYLNLFKKYEIDKNGGGIDEFYQMIDESILFVKNNTYCKGCSDLFFAKKFLTEECAFLDNGKFVDEYEWMFDFENVSKKLLSGEQVFSYKFYKVGDIYLKINV